MIKKGKARKRPTVEPFTQGELDGLCGIYTVLNAYRILFGEAFTHERAQKMFILLVSAFPRAVAEGLGYKELLNVLTLANANVPKPLRLEVRTEVFKKQPKGPVWRTDMFVRRLREEITEGKQLAILGLEKAHDHWTLLQKLTPQSVKLADSDKISHLRLKNLGIHKNTKKDYRIAASQTILLRPWVGSPNDKYKKLKSKVKLEL